MAIVKNIEGTSDKKCTCSVSWVEHWEKHSGKKAFYCNVYGCYNRDNIVGAHVQRLDNPDNSHYIIAICHEHNMSKEQLYVSDDLVSAICK